ncbi:MAG: pectate lyase [Gemmatimonadaceae bacterium]|nr:pectate lyase [Gemmatimonadaceae bacterium]
MKRIVQGVSVLAIMAGGCAAQSVVGPGASNTGTLPDSVVQPAPYTGMLLAATRIAALPAEQRAAWEGYVLTSRRQMAVDQAVLADEVRRAGLSGARRAPNTAQNFDASSSWTPAWTQSAAGRTLVNTVVSYQTPSGGWGKHVDYAQGARAAGTRWNSESDAWSYIGTIDNGATVNELRLLGVAASTSADTTVRRAFARGVRYLLQAQFPSGCWPQVFPLMGAYNDAATHNDDAMVNVVRLLRDVARGAWSAADASLRTDAGAAVSRAIACFVAQQVNTDGVRTTWAQQHDPLTHEPAQGRAYELPGLTGSEGARVMSVLMEEPAPSPALVAAVHAAATFYRATAIPNAVYVSGTGLVPTQGAAPVWARLMEIGTNRPFFANRDGIKLYDHAQLTDRRTGYAWYGNWPSSSLRTFDTWSRTNPLPR